MFFYKKRLIYNYEVDFQVDKISYTPKNTTNNAFFI